MKKQVTRFVGRFHNMEGSEKIRRKKQNLGGVTRLRFTDVRT